MNQKIENAFNKQINAELSSAYLYLSMAAYFESQNLSGMSHWMKKQAGEEKEHAMKFFHYLTERGGRVILSELTAPKTEWKSPLAAFEDAYKHECIVTGLINALMDLAQKEKDHASDVFLQWFVSEQVEEEAAALGIVERLKMAGDHKSILLMLDKELAKRGKE